MFLLRGVLAKREEKILIRQASSWPGQ